ARPPGSARRAARALVTTAAHGACTRRTHRELAAAAHNDRRPDRSTAGPRGIPGTTRARRPARRTARRASAASRAASRCKLGLDPRVDSPFARHEYSRRIVRRTWPWPEARFPTLPPGNGPRHRAAPHVSNPYRLAPG